MPSGNFSTSILPSKPEWTSQFNGRELATNAVTHARIPGRDFLLLLYVVGDTLRVEVTDTCGDRLPHPQHVAPEAESGRGLLLVEAFADRWGFSEGPAPRKTVWAEITLPPISRNPCCGGAGDPLKETRG